MNRRELLQLSAALSVSAGLRPTLADGAGEPKLAPDEMIAKYLAAETDRISKKFLDGAKSKEEWERKRPELKKQFLFMAGLDPLPEKSDLKAKITGTFEHGGVVIENVHFQSKPGLYVTGNLYRPKTAGVNPAARQKLPAARQKLPAILYVCGHSNKGRDGNKTAYQDHGLWFANNGYVCLVVDTLQLGEIAGVHHGTYGLRETNPVQTRFWWHSRGYTPAGVECWNGIRGIDYLCSRPEVDPDKIGVTGISGGGATTVWVAAADDRVKVAVPVSGMSDLQSYVTNKVINGHCDCMFVHNAYQWEWTTILALFAPKPLLFANSDMDPIFPMDGNRRIIARLRKCYEMLGAKESVDEYVSAGGHAYRPDLRKAIFKFFNHHLKGKAVDAADETYDLIPGKKLRAFPEDADLPKDSINATADETFVPKAEVQLPEAKDFKGWKASLVKQLREKVFRALPEKVPTAKALDVSPAGVAILSAEDEVCFTIAVLGFGKKEGGCTAVFFNPEEEIEKTAEEWKKRYEGNSIPISVHPRGGNFFKWTRKSPPNTVERSLALLGQTADAGRVRDAAASIFFWRRLEGVGESARIRLRHAGRGSAGIIGAYAALFVPGAVQEVEVIDPPTSHRDGPHFLNVMRVLDIPEALGLLAPDVKLTLIGKNARDSAFDKTAAIYKLAGAADKFKRE
jgi:dienelactone hydrolase